MANIAIIGSGISGLGAAYLLHSQHRITLYEQSPDIGGHARTRTVKHGDTALAVDTGFIVFNYRNYPYLSALFKHLDVPVQKSNMTFGITVNHGEIEWGAQSLNALFGQRRNIWRPAFWRFLLDIVRFNRHAVKSAERNPDFTLGQLIEKLGMGSWFAPYYILPMGGAIWSCPLNTMLQFPALTFVRFFKEHGLLTITQQPQWYTVTGGSKEYITRMVAPFKEHIRTSCGVVSVTRKDGKVQVTDVTGATQDYDHVVFACHADQALAMLSDATAAECELVGAFKFQKNRGVLHTDASVMPKRRRCWSSWVYHTDGEATSAISITYWMNLLQSIDARYQTFITLNPLKPIAAAHILDDHEFEHPVYSREAVDAQLRLPSMQGQNNIWFCGAWLRNGFHEDGLASAVEVARKLGAEVPWA